MVTTAIFQVRALALAYKFWEDTTQSTAVGFKFFNKKEVFFFSHQKRPLTIHFNLALYPIISFFALKYSPFFKNFILFLNFTILY